MKIFEEELPSESAVVMNVPLVEQYPELPRAVKLLAWPCFCNIVVMMLTRWSWRRTLHNESFEEDGLMGDMNIGFIGAMDTLEEDGLGVYVDPIIELAKQYVPSNSVRNLTGKSIQEIYKVMRVDQPL